MGELTGVVPLDGVDGVAGRGGVGEDAGVVGLHPDVEELHHCRTSLAAAPPDPRTPSGHGGDGSWI